MAEVDVTKRKQRVEAQYQCINDGQNFPSIGEVSKHVTQPGNENHRIRNLSQPISQIPVIRTEESGRMPQENVINDPLTDRAPQIKVEDKSPEGIRLAKVEHPNES